MASGKYIALDEAVNVLGMLILDLKESQTENGSGRRKILSEQRCYRSVHCRWI
jgi:hypothetical protein